MIPGVTELICQYRAGSTTPSQVIDSIYDQIEREPLQPVWISIVPRAEALARARRLEEDPHALALPLFGVPFAIKDNIDLEGLPTTAACPEFAYEPAKNAAVVDRLLAAGAIPIGKTNLDQFATGLVGVRSPYGACASVFDPAYISGGSSAGSAVAVAKRLVSFSLGTDTAGSGRVPAAFNSLVGLKPSRGLLSTTGVVPACRSIDCVSIFTADAESATAVWSVAQQFDASDPFSRSIATGADAAPWSFAPSFRFGHPRPDQLKFFGDTGAAELYQSAIQRLKSLGGEAVEIDLSPFLAAAELLYAGPWVAERFVAVGEIVVNKPDAVHPVVRQIIAGAATYSAADFFRAAYRLEELKRKTEEAWDQVDVLALPTTGTTYTHQQIESDPIALNSNLGYYTNFVNLLDLAAVAVPAGFRSSGLPFGVSFIGRTFSDEALLHLAARFEAGNKTDGTAPGCVTVAVVGAHLRGQPLNRELVCRGASFLATVRTSPNYRLYALRDTVPPKPGLVKDLAFSGGGVELELWSVPASEFGTFVAGIPAPLGIGNATLADGSNVKCFICETYSVPGSTEITEFGGWRNYLASKIK